MSIEMRVDEFDPFAHAGIIELGSGQGHIVITDAKRANLQGKMIEERLSIATQTWSRVKLLNHPDRLMSATELGFRKGFDLLGLTPEQVEQIKTKVENTPLFADWEQG